MFWVMSGLQIVIYTSDHGFEHAVRAVFLAEALICRGSYCHIGANLVIAETAPIAL